MAMFIAVLACNLTKVGDKWVCTKKDDTTPPLDKAIELFRELTKGRNKEVYIIVTAGKSSKEGNTIMCDRMKEYLVAQGIPSFNVFANKAEIFKTHGEMRAAYETISLYEEATETKAEKIFVCSRWFHVWRACLIGYCVRHFYQIKAPQYPVPTRSIIKWWKIPYALIYEALGLCIVPIQCRKK